jgi:hypothetical protein
MDRQAVTRALIAWRSVWTQDPVTQVPSQAAVVTVTIKALGTSMHAIVERALAWIVQ